MSEQFKPIAERARWRMVYDLFKAAEINETVTYEQMAGVLALDPKRHRHELQMAARRAGLELERTNKRAVDAVRGAGYRIVQPAEVLGLGMRRNRKAGKQIARGRVTVASVDLNTVDGTMRQALELLARGFAVQAEVNSHVLAWQRDKGPLIERIPELVDRLDRLEGERRDA